MRTITKLEIEKLLSDPETKDKMMVMLQLIMSPQEAKEFYYLNTSRDAMNEQLPHFSQQYLDWINQADLPRLTRSQHEFAEWALRNHKAISQIGDYVFIFESIRKWLRK